MTTFGIGLAFALGVSEAQAMDEKLLEERGAELIAVARGDFDCSGTEGQASLYRDKEGYLLVALALQAGGKDWLVEPFSPATGATLEFGKSDGKCQPLLLTDDAGDTYVVEGVENDDLIVKAQATAGDSEPDVIFRRPPVTVPGDPFVFGLDIELCDWDHYCWTDGCSQACAAWGVVRSYPCDPDGDGKVTTCFEYGCTHWKMQCIQPGW